MGPAPKYHNVIDPNLAVADGRWVPTDFEALSRPLAPIEYVIALELASRTSIGQLLPWRLAREILLLALPERACRAVCKVRSPIPGLDAHEDHAIHAAAGEVL